LPLQPISTILNPPRSTGEKTLGTENDDDHRPPMWIGHVSIQVPDVQASKEFFMKLGMRDAVPLEEVAILELRAGTHLIIQKAESVISAGTDAGFDLMVDDIDVTHAGLVEAGLKPGPIQENNVHRYFLVREPGGHDVVFNSSHNTGLPV
jgi:catechol 2,3-dioxygenase-like lactoylglutathione lyase family enzyme